MPTSCKRTEKKTMLHESDDDTNCNWHTWYSHQRTGTGIGGHGNKRTSRDHPNNSIVEIDRNTKKSLGDMKRLAVILTPVKNHQLMLVGKTLKGVIMIDLARELKKTMLNESDDDTNFNCVP